MCSNLFPNEANIVYIVSLSKLKLLETFLFVQFLFYTTTVVVDNFILMAYAARSGILVWVF